MTGKTHRTIGMTAAAAAAAYLVWTAPHYAPATVAAVLLAGHIGALLPDMDSTAGEIWQSIPMGKVVGTVASKAAFGHRNLTHSLVGLALFGGASWWLLSHLPGYWGLEMAWVWRAFMIGYVSHLLADGITEEGIPLLWPVQHMYGFPPRPFEDVRIVTGGWFENLIIFPAVAIIFWGGIYLYWPLIRLYLLK